MKLFNPILRQLSDLLAYVAVPLLSLVLPASVSRNLIRSLSNWNWLLQPEAHVARARAAEYTRIGDEREWTRRWRRVVMLEARDRALLAWGRRSAVFSEIEGRGQLDSCRDRVVVGMHWGPSISILSLLQSEGLNPLLVYRDEPFSIFWSRPFFYLYMAACVRYIRKSCGQRAVLISGAGKALRRELSLPGSSVVVLDAPPTPGRSTIGEMVLGRPVRFNAGFPGILEDSGREHVFYTISLDSGDGMGKRLEVTEPSRMESQAAFLGSYCRYLESHLQADSAQWRLWEVADQFFLQHSQPETGSPISSRQHAGPEAI